MSTSQYGFAGWMPAVVAAHAAEAGDWNLEFGPVNFLALRAHVEF